MSVLQHALKRGRYFDSVVLMQLQRNLAEMPGVHRVGVMMATAANQQLLVESGLLRAPMRGARADDLLIALDTETGRVAERALELFDELAKGRQAAATVDYRPKSLRSALSQLPAANWVLISVPGRYAAAVARQALAAGRNVFLYSDNVPLAEEVALKAEAWARGLLVLGPDCGTAIIAGVGLGFANRVRSGPIALVGASGTGLQIIASRIHALGSGVSQAIGTGGRDLSREVAAATALQALDLLAKDTATEVVVVVSKPPHKEVAARVLERTRSLGRPVVVQFQGFPPPRRQIGDVHFAADLEDAARLAVRLAAEPRQEAEIPDGVAGSIRGLFSGGTLAGEALLGLESMLPGVTSNLSGHRAERHAAAHSARGHVVLDLGADEFTVGRPHPMIDPQLVVEHLARAAADDGVTTVLLDVVLGDGAHPDPASLLAPAIGKAVGRRGRRLVVCVVLVGTDEDRQDLAGQRERLEAAGAQVFVTLGAAIERALAHSVAPAVVRPAPPFGPLAPPLAAVNVGLELFYEALADQEVDAVHVDWRPPAGGNERLGRILERLKDRGAEEMAE
jgi:FdrA protein